MTTPENWAELGRNPAPGEVHNVLRNVLRDLEDHQRVRLLQCLSRPRSSIAAAETKSCSMFRQSNSRLSCGGVDITPCPTCSRTPWGPHERSPRPQERSQRGRRPRGLEASIINRQAAQRRKDKNRGFDQDLLILGFDLLWPTSPARASTTSSATSRSPSIN